MYFKLVLCTPVLQTGFVCTCTVNIQTLQMWGMYRGQTLQVTRMYRYYTYKTSLLYRCTKPVYSTCIHRICMGMEFHKQFQLGWAHHYHHHYIGACWAAPFAAKKHWWKLKTFIYVLINDEIFIIHFHSITFSDQASLSGSDWTVPFIRCRYQNFFLHSLALLGN